MNLAEAYGWEAEQPDGSLLTKGGDLEGCVRVSLIPVAAGLPRHDFVGCTPLRRFGRGFLRVTGGGMREYLHCVVCRGFRIYCRSTDGGIVVTPEDQELYL